LLLLAALSLALVLLLSYSTSCAPEASGIVLVPAYFYPTSGDFQRLLGVRAVRSVIVVLNVFNGPGDRFDSVYGWAIEELLNRGMIPIGYVYTSYSRRNISEVKEDIDRWFGFYPKIRGVFIDEVGGDTSYYADLYNYVKSSYDGIVV